MSHLFSESGDLELKVTRTKHKLMILNCSALP